MLSVAWILRDDYAGFTAGQPPAGALTHQSWHELQQWSRKAPVPRGAARGKAGQRPRVFCSLLGMVQVWRWCFQGVRF